MKVKCAQDGKKRLSTEKEKKTKANWNFNIKSLEVNNFLLEGAFDGIAGVFNRIELVYIRKRVTHSWRAML